MVKKTDYNTKVTEIENKLNNRNHDKYITNRDFNTLAADVVNTRSKTSTFSDKKTDFDALLSIYNTRVSSNWREVLRAKDELNKLKTFDSS